MTTKAGSHGIQHAHYVLDVKVLAVASINHKVGDWAAYVGAVPGMRHADEWPEVAEQGSKLPQEVAEVLFRGVLELINADRKATGQDLLRWRA